MVDIVGDDGPNRISGTDGADTLSGLGGSDVLSGGDGDDTLRGGSEGDLLLGGNGTDTADYSTSSAGVIVDLRPKRFDDDSSASWTGDAQYDRLFSIENVQGSSFNDTLTGSVGGNLIDGYLGADTMAGLGGNDRYRVDNADDVVLEAVGDGIDEILVVLNTRFFALRAGAEVESISPIDPWFFPDIAVNITGNEFGQRIIGDIRHNTLDGRGGDDTLVGLDGDDRLWGQDGDDIIIGGPGNDEIFGGNGDDFIVGGPGGDDINGYNGIDVIDYSDSPYIVFVDLDQHFGANGDANGDQLDGIENVIGCSGNDTIRGDAAANVLDGRAGYDILGGAGGDDHYFVDNPRDAIEELADAGSDRVFSSISYALGAGAQVEMLTTTNNGGVGAINLTGNEFVNAIFGNAGANTLDGRGGADSLVGFGGNDFYFVDNAGDGVWEGAGEGTADRVLASVSYTLGAGDQVEILTTTNNAGVGAINLTGNEFANAIYGNAGVNVLNGKAGNDTLTGFGGNDFFLFDAALNAATNVDRVSDFNVPADSIRLENAIFTTLAAGALAAGAFHIGAGAADADDRIIYNSATGALIYDSNGNLLGGATQFATLPTGLALTSADFFVV